MGYSLGGSHTLQLWHPAIMHTLAWNPVSFLDIQLTEFLGKTTRFSGGVELDFTPSHCFLTRKFPIIALGGMKYGSTKPIREGRGNYLSPRFELWELSLTLSEGDAKGVFGLSLCSLGVGTYLGEPNDTVDCAQTKALAQLLGMGCNVIDTAPNYRDGRSERCVGKALSLSIEQGSVTRESVFLSTKAGLVPENESLPAGCHEGPDRSCFDPL